MPSPIGHALAGIASGWLVDPPPADAATAGAARHLAVFAVAGALPDVDLLVGAHSGPTHGLGAAVLVGAIVWAGGVALKRPGAARLALAVALAYTSHTLLDWLGTDTSAPIGIMALWPFDRQYYESSVHVFMAISRRYWLAEFWTYNLRALARELLILVPVVAGVVTVRRRRARPSA
jgi:inner membrane protein